MGDIFVGLLAVLIVAFILSRVLSFFGVGFNFIGMLIASVINLVAIGKRASKSRRYG